MHLVLFESKNFT